MEDLYSEKETAINFSKKMGILIAYDSLHDSAEKCIFTLKSGFNRNVDVMKLSQKNEVADWGKYEIVLIGSCVENEKMQESVIKFCEKYEDELEKKQLGIFISCLISPQKAAKIMDLELPQKLTVHAKIKGCFGGLLPVGDLCILKRLFRRHILRQEDDNFVALLHNAVTGFARAFDSRPKQRHVLNLNYFSAQES